MERKLLKKPTITIFLYAFWLTAVQTQKSINNLIQCPQSCNITTQPCDCYQDGWVDCIKRNLDSIPETIPKCVKKLVIRYNAISQLGM